MSISVVRRQAQSSVFFEAAFPTRVLLPECYFQVYRLHIVERTAGCLLAPVAGCTSSVQPKPHPSSVLDSIIETRLSVRPVFRQGESLQAAGETFRRRH